MSSVKPLTIILWFLILIIFLLLRCTDIHVLRYDIKDQVDWRLNNPGGIVVGVDTVVSDEGKCGVEVKVKCAKKR